MTDRLMDTQDFNREKDLRLRSYSLKEFVALIFRSASLSLQSLYTILWDAIRASVVATDNLLHSLDCCRQVPGLRPFQHQLEEIYYRFNAYKQTIPTMGAIILDPSMERCLLVRGWRSVDGWGFPTGKINKDEADDACAVREARCTNVSCVHALQCLIWQACMQGTSSSLPLHSACAASAGFGKTC